MNEKNLEYNPEKDIYVDKYNGIEYKKIGDAFVSLVAGGLPAKMEEYNGKNYLINNTGTYEIEDGKVSSYPLKSLETSLEDDREIDGIPEIEEVVQKVRGQQIEEAVSVIQNGVLQQEMPQNQFTTDDKSIDAQMQI